MIDVINIIQTELTTWAEAAISWLPSLVLAVLILVATKIVANKTSKFTRKQLDKSKTKDSLTTLVTTTVYVVVLGIGTFFALEAVHLDKAVTSLLAGAGIIGLALAFAFQDLAANFVSGVLLATNNFVRVGDLVETNGFFGHIQKIDLRTTTIQTLKGQTVIVPNNDILSSPLTNYSETPRRRVDVVVGVGYAEDLRKAKKVALESISDMECVDKEKDVDGFYGEMADSSINLTVRFWTQFHKSNKKYLNAQSRAIVAIQEAFNEEDINIPFPVRTIDVPSETLEILR